LRHLPKTVSSLSGGPGLPQFTDMASKRRHVDCVLHSTQSVNGGEVWGFMSWAWPIES
jgi:hypothetical protein